jgi:hypothetical protein
MAKKTKRRAQQGPTFEQLKSDIKDLGAIKKDVARVRKKLKEFLDAVEMSSGNVSKQQGHGPPPNGRAGK